MANAPAPSTQQVVARQGQAAMATLPPQLRRWVSGKNIKFVLGQNPESSGTGNPALADVERGSPDTITVYDAKKFADPYVARQLVAHEVTHLIQNNLPAKVQAQIPPDEAGANAYGYGGDAGLAAHRAQGGTLWTLPREKAAAAMQYYVAQQGYGTPQMQKQREAIYGPYLNDLDRTPQAPIAPTPDSSNTLNVKPNAPLPPPEALGGN